MIKTYAIVATSRFAGNSDMKFESLLPILCSLWPAMGDAESLRQIGKELDKLPVGGSERPEWNSAIRIADIHEGYICHGGRYHSNHPTPGPTWTQYLPGTVLASPVYYGRYGVWAFGVELRDGPSKTVVHISVGPEDDTKARTLYLDIDDGDDVIDIERVAAKICEALYKVGINAEY